MKHTTIKNLIYLITCLLLPLNIQAEPCNPQQPSFTVDGVEQWSGKKASEIFNQLEKTTLAKAKKDHSQVILFETLIKNLPRHGTLITSSCEQKNLIIEIKDLYSEDNEEQKYALSLTRKGTFKVISQRDSKMIMKDVNSIKLVSIN